MVDIQTRVNDYFASQDINNSLLNLCFNPKWLEFKLNNRDLEDTEKEHFRVGSAIDSLLTQPKSFSQEFYVWTHSRPAGLMAKFVDALPENLFMLDLNEKAVAYDFAYTTSTYKKPKKTVIKDFEETESLQAYYNARIHAEGKKILSSEDMKQVENAVNSLNIVETTKQYFSAFNANPDIEIIHQVPVYFKLRGLNMKCLLDGVKINHTTKEILPFDLKSIGKSVYEFEDSFYQYGYYRQFALYTKAIEIAVENHMYPFEHEKYKDYIILPFEAVVTPKKEDGYPALIYQISPDKYKLGLIGGTHNNKEYKGIYELINNFKYHISARDFRAPKWVIDKDFKLVI